MKHSGGFVLIAVSICFLFCLKGQSAQLEPYFKILNSNISNGDSWNDTFSVPQGKVLIIESVSAGFKTLDKARIVEVQIIYNTGMTGKEVYRHYIPVIYQGTWKGSDALVHYIYVGSESVKLYVKPGIHKFAYLRDKKTNWAWASATISGKLIPKDSVILSP